ncbi:MAG TPA: hypothetical protein VEH76_02410 [Methylocystis sp.]|nr:hypothetical protein [Methylocystis sp.]
MSWKRRFAFALSAALLAGAAPAGAVPKLGPNFPLPGDLTVSGRARDALLKLEQEWLETGLKNLEKAQKEASEALDKAKAANAKPEEIAALEGKLKGLDAEIASTREDLALATDEKDLSKERQRERKRELILIVDQWIRALGAQATAQLKIAILSDGAAADEAERRHAQLSEQADALERAKHDSSIENWVISQ